MNVLLEDVCDRSAEIRGLELRVMFAMVQFTLKKEAVLRSKSEEDKSTDVEVFEVEITISESPNIPSDVRVTSEQSDAPTVMVRSVM